MNVNWKAHPLPWRWVRPGEEVRLDRKDRRRRIFLADDHCIVDRDGFEVLASSEYLRADLGVLEYICAAVNRTSPAPARALVQNALQPRLNG